jgi:hypothetical protein
LRREQLANGNINNVAKRLMTLFGLAPPQYDTDFGNTGILCLNPLYSDSIPSISISAEAFGTTPN